MGKINSKGQLFVVEVLISVSLLLLLTTLVYQARVNITSVNNDVVDPTEDVYAAITSLRSTYDLDQYISDAAVSPSGLTEDHPSKLLVKRTIQAALGPKYLFRLTLLDRSTSSIIDIANAGIVPPGTAVLSFITYNVFTVFQQSAEYTITITAWSV